jgi:hypothetical protein
MGADPARFNLTGGSENCGERAMGTPGNCAKMMKINKIK